MPGPPGHGRPAYSPGHHCRLFRVGLCTRGADCPLLHVEPAEAPSTVSKDFSTGSPAPSDAGTPDGQDNHDSQSRWSWSWTSSASSESRSWADLSEELWFSAAPAGTPAGRANGAGPSQPPGAGGRPGGWAPSAPGAVAPPDVAGGLPSFSGRVTNIPEFLPGEAVPAAAPQGGPRGPKSKSATRRRQRMVMEKWVTMKAKNGAVAAEMVEAACIAVSGPLAHTQREPRTESASPPRPLVPPTSPRKQKRGNRDDHDSDDSGDDGGDGAVVSTKVSL